MSERSIFSRSHLIKELSALDETRKRLSEETESPMTQSLWAPSNVCTNFFVSMLKTLMLKSAAPVIMYLLSGVITMDFTASGYEIHIKSMGKSLQLGLISKHSSCIFFCKLKIFIVQSTEQLAKYLSSFERIIIDTQSLN